MTARTLIAIALLTIAGCAPPPTGPATCPPEHCIVQVTP